MRPKLRWLRASLLRLWPLVGMLAACGKTTINITNQESSVDLDSGLIAYLRFDETDAGLTAVDASGYGHDGTPSTSAPTPNVSVPPIGFANPRSLSFNGNDQLVDLGSPEELDVAGQLTLASWMRPLETNGYRNIIAHGFRWGPERELSLRIHDGRYEFTFWTGADHQAGVAMTPGDVESWHHIVGTYDGQSYRLYRDGVRLAEQADAVAPTRFDAPWAVGGRSANVPVDPRFFSGSIDEVRIYERALSDDEVRALARL